MPRSRAAERRLFRRALGLAVYVVSISSTEDVADYRPGDEDRRYLVKAVSSPPGAALADVSAAARDHMLPRTSRSSIAEIPG